MMNYQTMIDKDSMYNTPPCWCIYMLGLTLDWVEEQGGIPEMARRKQLPLLHAVRYPGQLPPVPLPRGEGLPLRHERHLPHRQPELDAKFVQEATDAGFVNLKGHRKVGGMRASIYNAMPVEGVEKLCDFIKKFDQNN